MTTQMCVNVGVCVQRADIPPPNLAYCERGCVDWPWFKRGGSYKRKLCALFSQTANEPIGGAAARRRAGQ